jgi:hypothetical protein
MLGVGVHISQKNILYAASMAMDCIANEMFFNGDIYFRKTIQQCVELLFDASVNPSSSVKINCSDFSKSTYV